MMNILIAIDSFKGSISSEEASKAISSGILHVYPEANIKSIPLADGGEGTVNALIHTLGGRFVEKEVHGPLGEKVRATYGIIKDGKTAIIEVASACGLTLVHEEKRNALRASSYGVGELITDALDKGCRKFIIGLGGSATTDGGVGMLKALGFEFLDSSGQEIGPGGMELQKIEHIHKEKAHPLIEKSEFLIACDVHNYLYGNEGAAHVFGPQKGASQKEVEILDKGLRHFANKTKNILGIDIHQIEGAGAAGGLGAAFSGYLKGSLQSGIDIILDLANIETYLNQTDFVITGEGKLDGQTALGKAPFGVAKRAKKYGVPVIALAGGISGDVSHLNNEGITACFSILQAPMSIDEAMDQTTTRNNLEYTSMQLFRLIQAVQNNGK